VRAGSARRCRGRARPAPHRPAITCAADALQGVPRASAAARHELLERVGLGDAADRKVGGYFGGMKRRLRPRARAGAPPRVLFLDEPTTGPRPVEPTRLGRGGPARRDDGVTVFLTTQYLEEADVLADASGSSTRAASSPRGRPTR
jgi:ABC-type multidrug transport system ATPase subunit